jgi:hypothetical protein
VNHDGWKRLISEHGRLVEKAFTTEGLSWDEVERLEIVRASLDDFERVRFRHLADCKFDTGNFVLGED